MKRALLLFAISIILMGCSVLYGGPNASMSTYKDGYWGKWFPPDGMSWTGTTSKLTFYARDRHPSDYSFIISIDDPVSLSPSKEWSHYKGSITFRANTMDTWTNAQKSEDFVDHLQSYQDTYFIVFRGIRTTTRPAKVDLLVSRKKLTFNVFFDGVGFAVEIPR